MKKKVLRVLALLLVSCLIAGCGKGTEKNRAGNGYEVNLSNNSEAIPTSTASDPFKDLPEKLTGSTYVKATPDMYSNIDLKKEKTVYIYLIGTTPNDFPQIVELANEYLKPFNTKVEFTIMAWSDYADLYSLNLTSGTNIDAIFTAPWCYLWTESSKGSFMTLSEDFITDYMPLTRKYQVPGSWGGVKIDGNIIAIPQNATNPNGMIVAIRQDLAEKYGIKELHSWADYKNYVMTIAEKETPVSGIVGLAAAGGNGGLWEVYRQQYDTIIGLNAGTTIYYYKYDGDIPSYDEIEFAYSTDYFRDFCYEMKEMADAGVWSRSALTNEIGGSDAFSALASASFSWNTAVFNGIDNAEKAEGVVGAAYDITPDNLAIGEPYNNNDMAITASSQNPERTAMVLDIIKNDTYMHRLFCLGIEGVHYSIDENGVYTALDKAEDYPADSLSLSWAIKDGTYKQAGIEARKQAMIDSQDLKVVASPTEAFIFNDANVAFEVSAVNTILDEYIPSLQLGLIEDIDGTIATMIKRAKDAGLDRIEAEFKKQYEEWYSKMK